MFYEDNKDGVLFQEYVIEVLKKDGLFTYCTNSKQKQLEQGEGPVFEIKHDREWKNTGNFYIEVEAKELITKPDGRRERDWVPSGIQREDRTWLWCVGDYEEFFIQTKNVLQIFHGWKKFPIATTNKKDDTPTRGMLLPVPFARRHAGRIYVDGNAIKIENKELFCSFCEKTLNEEEISGTFCPDCSGGGELTMMTNNNDEYMQFLAHLRSDEQKNGMVDKAMTAIESFLDTAAQREVANKLISKLDSRWK